MYYNFFSAVESVSVEEVKADVDESAGKRLVYVSHHLSPGQFWINTVQQETELKTLEDKIQEFYSEESNCKEIPSDDLSEGAMCVARYACNLLKKEVHLKIITCVHLIGMFFFSYY